MWVSEGEGRRKGGGDRDREGGASEAEKTRGCRTRRNLGRTQGEAGRKLRQYFLAVRRQDRP